MFHRNIGKLTHAVLDIRYQPAEEGLGHSDVKVRIHWTLCLYAAVAAAVPRSVSLAAGRREELLSVVVPLADQETSATVSTDSLTAATVLARPAHL